jgi:hypothetical protein
MNKKNLLALLLICSVYSAFAQEEEELESRGFKKENLFTGGSISLSFFNNTFLIGANPVLGYRIANWLDAGIVLNYQYSSARDYYTFDDKLRQSIYGGGVFTRIYPVNFLFGTAQLEHNFQNVKYIPPNGGNTIKSSTSANSVLVGAGYASGRAKEGNSPFFYMSLMWDVSGNENSPYTDQFGRSVPIIRAGFNIPLFQGGGAF